MTDEGGPTVSTDAGSNASAIVLKGSDLDALSDDPDELSNELTALAGPSAGPNGGQIYIDGFTGGTIAAQVGDPRDSHQSESVFGGVRPHRLWAHRDSHQAGNRQAAWAGLHPGQRQRHSIPAIRSPPYCPLTTASSTTARVSGAISKRLRTLSAWNSAISQHDSVYTILNGPVFNSASNTYSISPGSVSGSLFSPAIASGDFAAHRSATGSEEHADVALPVRAQQRD